MSGESVDDVLTPDATHPFERNSLGSGNKERTVSVTKSRYSTKRKRRVWASS